MMFLYCFMVITLAASVCVHAEKETELIYIPPYSKFLEDTLLANVLLMNDVKLEQRESVEFLKVYISVIDLADQVGKKGENAYPEFYMETVKKTLKQVTDNPVEAESNLWKLVKNTNMELVEIESFILYKQITECKMLLTDKCDSIIASEINDKPDLKKRAELLEAGGKQASIFRDISNHLRNAPRKDHFDAEKFLLTGADVLKPLVLAAYKTQKVVESLKL